MIQNKDHFARTDHDGVVIRIIALSLACTLLSSCDALPRDIEDTSNRIAASHRIRVGLDGAPGAAAQAFLARLERATGAKVVFEHASLEQLVARLDDDRLDLIVAPVRAEAALADEVALSPPLDGSAEGDRPVQVRAAVRNGENRWVMTVERAARGRP